MRLTALIRHEGAWFVASNPETGTTTPGRTFEEALANLEQATALYREELPQVRP